MISWLVPLEGSCQNAPLHECLALQRRVTPDIRFDLCIGTVHLFFGCMHTPIRWALQPRQQSCRRCETQQRRSRDTFRGSDTGAATTALVLHACQKRAQDAAETAERHFQTQQDFRSSPAGISPYTPETPPSQHRFFLKPTRWAPQPWRQSCWHVP